MRGFLIVKNYDKEIKLYHENLYEINKRIEVIRDHINSKTKEKYLVVEVETVCLQFRKILEKIALLSLIANKDIYSQQYEKFAKHYHAERILNDVSRINPDYYPIPVEIVKKTNDMYELVPIESGFLTKQEFIKIYEICGGMMHADNPYANPKPIKDIQSNFKEWLMKIYNLLKNHNMRLVGGKIMLGAILARADNGLPQVVILERLDD